MSAPVLSGDRKRNREPILTLALHGLLFSALTWWSWRKWPDPLVDFGRELYVPWQITEGAVLNRDIATLFGPLSPYVNAGWMALFGVSLTTIVLANLAILALTAALVHLLVRRATDALTATLSSVVLLTMFGFSQYVETGNYNFITPYAHEATHGLLLSVAALLAFHTTLADRHSRLAPVAGISLGLLLLTKPETTVAAVCAIAVGSAGFALSAAGERRQLSKALTATAVSAIVPPAIVFAFYLRHLDAKPALLAVGNAWANVTHPDIARLPFYLRVSGLNEPVVNVATMTVMFLLAVAILVLAVAAFSVESKKSLVRTGLGVALVVWLPFGVWAPPWGRALPLVSLTGMVASAGICFLIGRDRRRSMKSLLLLMWSTFALVLLGKIVLNAHIYHYGFYLALPATILSVAFVGWMIPRGLEILNFGEGAIRFKRFAVWAVAVTALVFLSIANRRYEGKTLALGTGPDRFLGPMSSSEWQSAAVSEAVSALRELATVGDRVAVLPEGVMINYLARLQTPLQATNLMPPEWLVFGEAEVLRTLQEHPPEFVVYVHRSTWEYGYPLFGSTSQYGAATMAWVDTRYDVIRVVGRQPRNPDGYGLQVLRIRAPRTGPPTTSPVDEFSQENRNSGKN